MDLGEVIDRLQSLLWEGRRRYGDNWMPEVLIVGQPNYPLQNTVKGVAAEWLREPEDQEYDSADGTDENPLPPEVVYIVEGGHPHQYTPYGPSWPFEINQGGH